MSVSDPPIRVCQLWDEYLPVFSGAAIRHDQQHPLLHQLEVIAQVLTVQSPGTPLHEMLNNTSIHRVPPGKSKNRIIRHVVAGLRLSREIISRRSQFDVLYSLSTNVFHLPALLTAHWLSKPVILEFNLMPSVDISPAARLLLALAYYCYRRFDAYIPISTALRNSIVERGLDVKKCHLIPVGVFPEIFVPLEPQQRSRQRDRFGLDSGFTYLLFVGSLIHRKGVDILVEAMARLVAIRPDIHLILIGQHEFPEGHLARDFAESIKHLIKIRNLQGQIRLLGRLEASEVLPWLQVCDIFVFPSRREGLVRVILEAMSVGMPCISSSMDGSAFDMIEPEVNGIILNQVEPEAVTDQVLRLLKDPELRRRLGEQARRTVMERFDERDFAAAYRKVFEDVLRARLSINK